MKLLNVEENEAKRMEEKTDFCDLEVKNQTVNGFLIYSL